MTFDWDDTEAPVDGAIWYPALKTAGTEDAITYELAGSDVLPAPVNFLAGRAILDAEPDDADGPYPLIVSSHGFAGSFNLMAYQHEHLASYGLVVIAIAHDGNTWRDAVQIQTPEQQAAFGAAAVDSMIRRPLEVNRAIDYAEALSGDQGQLAGIVDLDHVGVIGMSYGGYTAVMMAGVRPDFREAAVFCDQGDLGSPITQMVCQNHRDDLLGFEAHLIEVAGVDAEPGTLWPTLSDPRVDAAVAIVPGGGLSLIGTEGLAAAETPIMIMRATKDEVDMAEHNAARVWESISSTDKTLVTVENATHTFAMYCSPEMEAMMGAACVEPEWDKAQLLDLTNHFVTAFFLAELHGDEDAAAALAPDTVSFPGIAYETTGF